MATSARKGSEKALFFSGQSADESSFATIHRKGRFFRSSFVFSNDRIIPSFSGRRAIKNPKAGTESLSHGGPRGSECADTTTTSACAASNPDMGFRLQPIGEDHGRPSFPEPTASVFGLGEPADLRSAAVALPLSKVQLLESSEQ